MTMHYFKPTFMARVVNSDAGNDGREVEVFSHDNDKDEYLVKAKDLRAVRDSDGAVRLRDWGKFRADQLEPM